MSAATCLQLAPFQAHGLPNWADLHTGQAGRARDFYNELLGWTFQRQATLTVVPGPGDWPDRIQRFQSETSSLVAVCGDQPVAEIVGRTEPFDAMNRLSTWFPYIYVDDIEAVLEHVEPCGGLVLSRPTRRADRARVATILDPSDALLCLWEPLESIGAPAGGLPGSPNWFDLETNDLDRAVKFYGALFGWDAAELPMPWSTTDDSYLMFTRFGDPVAGAVASPLPDLSSSWCTSFAVTDTDEATARAVAGGAVVMVEPTEIPVGRQAVLIDPVGALFALLGPSNARPRPL